MIRQKDAPPELHADHYGALRDTWREADEVVVRCFPAILMLLLSYVVHTEHFNATAAMDLTAIQWRNVGTSTRLGIGVCIGSAELRC